MIAFIRGTVAAYGADWVIVENNGMGWRISYPHTDTVRLNQNISVYTFMHVSENDVGLYGFESQEEEEFFFSGFHSNSFLTTFISTQCVLLSYRYHYPQ